MSTPDTGEADPPLDPRAAFAELSKIMLAEQQLSETLGCRWPARRSER
jgi:hypothetical protein